MSRPILTPADKLKIADAAIARAKAALGPPPRGDNFIRIKRWVDDRQQVRLDTGRRDL